MGFVSGKALFEEKINTIRVKMLGDENFAELQEKLSANVTVGGSPRYAAFVSDRYLFTAVSSMVCFL